MKRTVSAIILAWFAAGPAGANLMCGLPPIPPIGCKLGPCVCDASGRNCHWTFICGQN